MEYSTINALFISLPIAIAYLAITYYFRRRVIRLRPSGSFDTQVTSYKTTREAIVVLILVILLRMLVASLIDDHWDNLRHTYDIPARSIDALLLVGFANAGLMAALLVALVSFIEIYDFLRRKTQD